MSRKSATTAGPLLLMVRPLAVLGVVAMLSGRALAPAVVGIGVGLDRTIRAIEITGGATSQLYAIAATVVAMAEILLALRSGLSSFARSMSIVLGSFLILVALTASAMSRVPPVSSAIVGVCTGAFALLIAWDARRVPWARGVALALAAAGAGALMRLVGVGFAFGAEAWESARMVPVARAVATLSFVLDAAALGIASAWILTQSRRLTSPVMFVGVVAAFVLARNYVSSAEPVEPLRILAKGAVERLLTRPDPFMPASVRAFVAVLSPFAALAAVFARDTLPILTGGLALVLLAKGSPETPLGALSLFIGALSIGLASRDDRALWAGIDRLESSQDSPP